MGKTLMAPLHAVEGFVFALEDARRLAAVRVGLFGVLALRVATTDFTTVAGQPAALFDPVSLFHVLPSMPSATMATAVQLCCIPAALLAAGGLAPRLSFPIAFATAVFLELMLNANGKIVHNDLVLTLCLLPLLAAPRTASRAWSIPTPRRRAEGRQGALPVGVAYGWPVRCAMLIIALAYLFVGLQKLRFSGLDWATTDNLRWVLYASSDSHADPNVLALFVADRAWLTHLLAAATLAVEIGFILCLPIPRLRWVFVPGVVGLHLGIWAAMGLNYSAQAAAVVIVFVNWTRVREWSRETAFRHARSRATEQEALP
jgi:hypothetical protein